MDRSEHLQWCKDRALAYVDDGKLPDAIGSMLSDLGKHPETAKHVAIGLTGMLMFGGYLNEVDEVRRHIEGFN